jgi:superfamily II DNA or RNA helicase
MTKAVISNRIYLNCAAGSDLELELGKALRYEISQEPVSEYPLIINNLLRITDNVVSIPAGCVSLIPEDYIITDKRCYAPVDICQPKFVPRENQQECIDYICDNGLVNAKVGWGKTIAGLGIAHKLQQKTLIITTTTTIRDMWIKEVEKWFGFKAGVIGGGQFKTDSPIVVGNIQTIRNKCSELSDMFGIVIVDEVHRSPAKTFTDTLNTLKARYKIGLSGTLERKDGLHCVLEDYFGAAKFIAVRENTIDPEVHLHDTGYVMSANEFIPWANKITELVNDTTYRSQVIALANSYAELGHKVLVLSDRTEFLEHGHLETDEWSLMITGKITGSDNRQQIMDTIADVESGAQILWGTQSIFSEGVSINELSVVILAAPINNEPLLEQICGRVMRMAEGKLQPVIVDVGLSGSTGKRHRNNRKRFYINKGWIIKALGQI